MYNIGTEVSITSLDSDHLPVDLFGWDYFTARKLGEKGKVICSFTTVYGVAYIIDVDGLDTFVYGSEIECYAEVTFKDRKKGGLSDWLKV